MAKIIFLIGLVSLLSLQSFCLADESQDEKPQEKADLLNVTYHLWFHHDANNTALLQPKILQVSVAQGLNFTKVMDAAADLDEKYRYDYIQYPFGKYITSIGGVSEDLDNEIYWIIYEPMTSAPKPENPPTKLSNWGVDQLAVEHNKHYLFWLSKPDY